MKTKDLFWITLKIIGLIAIWKSVEAFGVIIIGIGVISSLFSNNEHESNYYLLTIGLSLVLNFILPLIVAIIFIYKTDKVLSMIKLDEQSNIDLNINKQVLYHVIIIIFGFTFIIYGAGNFINYSHKTDTKTEYISNDTTASNQTPNITNEKITSVTVSKVNQVNYFALIEIIIGIILLFRAIEISKLISSKLDYKTDELTDKTNEIIL